MWQQRMERLGTLVEAGVLGFGAVWLLWALLLA